MADKVKDRMDIADADSVSAAFKKAEEHPGDNPLLIITGAEGLIGNALMSAFECEAYWDVYGIGREKEMKNG